MISKTSSLIFNIYADIYIVRSDTIVYFAKAISGGNKSKLDKLIAAIDKGFSEAGKALGGLPEISMKTYDRIMEKLDVWKNE